MSKFEVSVREGTGKGAARRARQAGMVPGVIYGAGKDPITINVPYSELVRRLNAGKFLTTLQTLTIDGQDERVICRAIERDRVKDLPTHIDFLRLGRNSRINLNIPVTFINEDAAPGLNKGGTLVVVRNEVELVVRASNIPDEIFIDLTGKEIGDTLNISDVDLPEGAKPVITDRDFTIANISAPRSLADEEEDADAPEADEVEATAQSDEAAEGDDA